MFNGTVITKEGQSVLAYCIANELPIQFTYMKIGDGVLSTETEEELSDLISEQLAVLIEHKSCSDGIYMLRAVFTNQSLSAGFYIRECGVFVNNPETNQDVLFAYDNAGAGEDVDYFAPGNGKVILKEVFEMAASVGNDANVTLVINPSLVYVTLEEFNLALKNSGNYISNKKYKPNDIFTYDNSKYLVETEFTSSSVPDFSKVYILARKGYDHFTMEIDARNFSNPSTLNGGIKYSGGCEKFRKQDWVDWLNYRPCIMNGQGGIEKYLDPNNYEKDINGNSVDISTVSDSVRNVMIRFKRIGLISNQISQGKWIIRATNDPCDTRYMYSAFDIGKRQGTAMYIGAYNGSISGNKLHSVSGAEIASDGQSLSSYRNLAQANGMNYQLLDVKKLSFLKHLYMLQNATINGKLSNGYSNNNRTTGTLNTTGMNKYITNDQMSKFMGLESNCFSEAIDGALIDSNFRLKIAKSNLYTNDGSGYEDCGKIYTLSEGYMSSLTTFSVDCGIIANNYGGTADTAFNCPTKAVSAETFMIFNPTNMFNYEYTRGAEDVLKGLTARLAYTAIH